MSVMDRLRAIRGRMSSQAEDAPAAPAPEAFPAEDEAAPAAAAGAASAPPPLRSVNMWDMAVEDPVDDEPPLPDDSAPDADATRLMPFPALPAPAEPDAAAGGVWAAGDSGWPPRAQTGATSSPVPPATPERDPSGWPPATTSGFGSRSAPIEPRRGGRVKTRLLGVEHSSGASTDFSDILAAPAATQPPAAVMFPVGWLVVTSGPGRGSSFALSVGVSQIGRGEDQAVRLDFGDTTISRTGHAAIAFDDETRAFFIGHGGKSNLVRLNGRPLLSTETLAHGDQIQIGETALRLVALCGEDFTWAEETARPSAIRS